MKCDTCLHLTVLPPFSESETGFMGCDKGRWEQVYLSPEDRQDVEDTGLYDNCPDYCRAFEVR